VLHWLRRGMSWFEYVAGVFVLLTGLYLTWYWYTDITNKSSGVVTGAVSWQERLTRFVERNQTAVVVCASLVVAVAIGLSLMMKRRSTTV